MENQVKLSIIVPVYNMAGGKLEYCLESLLRQDAEDYEIITIDDRSTDNSLAVLREYEKKYPKKICVIPSSENRRQGGAKNLGLQAAQGEWIGFMDSDDWAAPDMFSKLLRKAAETGADVVGCDYLRVEEIGKEDGVAVLNNLSEQTGVLDAEKRKSLILKPGSMVVKIYKRELFAQHDIKFPEKMFYEDNAISVLPMLYARQFERVEECLYFYYQHPSSTVHVVNMERCEDRVKAAGIYLRECKERGFYETYKLEIDYKVFELGYRNTLFSYLQTVKTPSLKFVVRMKQFLQETVPDFEKNPYYKKYMDAENQKLISMHMRNAFSFLLYYKLLYFYRKLRYGK